MPFGYTTEEWNVQSESQKQIIRNFVWSQARIDLEGTGAPAPVIHPDIIQNPDNFDNTVGASYVYDAGLFANVNNLQAGRQYGDAANEQLKKRAQQIHSDAEEGWKKSQQTLRLGRNKSYSGCDVTPSITVGSKTFVLGNVSTLSYSIHRDKVPVRVLGHTYPKGFVSGGRSIAGTLIFTVFDRHVLSEVFEAIVSESDPGRPFSSPLTDQIPPFDVTIMYQNEYGNASYMRIYGIEVSDEGQTHSINDIYTENVMQYVARDIDLMTYSKSGWTPQGLAFTNTTVQFQNDIDSTRLNNLKQILADYQKKQVNLDNELRRLQDEQTAYTTLVADGNAAVETDLDIVNQRISEIPKEQQEVIYGIQQSTAAIANLEESIGTNTTESGITKRFTNAAKDSPYAFDRSRMK